MSQPSGWIQVLLGVGAGLITLGLGTLMTAGWRSAWGWISCAAGILVCIGALLSHFGLWRYYGAEHPLLVVLSTGIIVGLVGAGSAWLLLPPHFPKLEFWATTTTAEFPLGTNLAGIPWRSPFVELRVVIMNQSAHAHEDLDMVFTPNGFTAAVGQVGNLPEVSFAPRLEQWLRMELHQKTGSRQVIPLVLIATDAGYRLRCAKLPGKGNLEIIMAVVSMPAPGVADEPIQNPFDKSYRIRVGRRQKDESGEKSYWYAHPDRTDAVYGPRVPVEKLSITGSYTVLGQTRAVSQQVKVRDLIGEAAKRIPRPNVQPSKP